MEQELNLNCFDCNKSLQDCTCMEDTIDMTDPLEQATKEYAEMHLDVSGNLGKYLVKAVFQDDAQWQINLKRNKMKQETLEEVAERILDNNIDGLRDALKDDDLFYFYKGVIQSYGEVMAKCQAKKMYSEEEVIELLTKRCEHFGTSVSPFDKLLLKQDLEWFNNIKKK